MGKKGLFYLILIYSLANSAFASDKVFTNPNPIGGDILVADTCTHDMFEAVLFQALPTDYDGSWALVTSDSDLGYFVYDDYEAFGTITALHWWGSDLHYDSTSGWAECDEDPMTFNINFCPDNGSGAPNEANPACTYTIALAHYPYAVCVLDSVYQLWEWYTLLDPVCNMQQGWVGIQGVGNADSCVFMWYNSTENVFGYNSYQDGGYTDFQQAFCLNGTG